jgi:hypothetical protein
MFRIYFLLPLLIPLVFVKGDFGGKLFRPVERWLARVAANRARAIAMVGIVSFLLSMGISLLVRIPTPYVSDEFAYLLLGDTFAHGRVTNPPLPLWEHFETSYEIMQPTYTAIYPPGQGVALAAGELLGMPIIGVWLSTALACAAVCWMLMAWMPERWALAGGLMVALHPLILEWSQDYWGGAVAMAGGALVIGAFRRILREPRASDAVWMGIGLAVLANSRPFEGFVIGLLTMVALLGWFMMSAKAPFPIIFQRVVCPLLAVLVLLGAQIGYYDWRVTGNPLLMPHLYSDEIYGIAPQFLFAKARPEPEYRHAQMRKLYEDYLTSYKIQRSSLLAVARATLGKILTLAQGYLWSCLMLVALLALPWALRRDPCLRIALVIGLLFLCAQLTASWVFPHYAAPAAGLFFVLVLQSMRTLNAWHTGIWRRGRNLVRGLAVIFVISLFQLVGKMAGKDATGWYSQRHALLEKLRLEPDKSLVLVHYDPDHNPNREWVYNDADLDDSKVILAQDMGPRKNKELLDYFRDRKAWLVNADAAKPELEPYPGS